MSQQSGINPIGSARPQDVPTPSGNNISFFLNANDGNLLYGKRSNGSVFLVPTSNSAIPLASTKILVGDANGVAAPVTVAKDLTMANNGFATVVGIQGTTVIAGPYTAGDMLYYDGTFWQVLQAGVANNGKVLTVVAGVPAWV